MARPPRRRRRRGRSRLREAAIGLTLTVASLAAALLGAEVAVRLIASGGKLWEFRNYVSDPEQWRGRWRTMQPDEQLGYVPRPGYSGTDHGNHALLSFDDRGFRAHHRGETPPAQATPPVLVVGDSYAMGAAVTDDQSWPAHLERVLDRRVINAGVPGYGLDQIVLRAEALVPALHPEPLIVGFIADDVRRAEARILWGLEKPYFDVVNGTLVERNVPVKPPASTASDAPPLDLVRRILGYSFMADVAMRRLGLMSYWRRGQPSQVVAAHDQGERVACLLMDRLGQLGQTSGVRITVVAQYSTQAWLGESFLREEARVIEGVLACARKSGLGTLDTRAAVEAAVRADGVWRYYAGTHMNDAGNRLTATELALHLKEIH
jgi:hypothetical protein